MNGIEMFISNISYVLIGVAMLCTLVTVITEFTKEVGFLKRIPTDFQVLITSMIICLLVSLSYISYKGIAIEWYYLVAIIFAGFFIAIICTKGWTYLTDIWKRFYIKREE